MVSQEVVVVDDPNDRRVFVLFALFGAFPAFLRVITEGREQDVGLKLLLIALGLPLAFFCSFRSLYNLVWERYGGNLVTDIARGIMLTGLVYPFALLIFNPKGGRDGLTELISYFVMIVFARYYIIWYKILDKSE
jgi:hypothetical protein